MRFDIPVLLLVAPVVAAAVWLATAWARHVRVRRAALWSDETARLAQRAGRFGPTGLSLAAFLGVVALAGPRWGEERIVAETRGLTLVIAVDISRSMLAEDVQPSRLGRALREAGRLVLDLEGDRLGLVAFAGTSYILSPLTVDASALQLYLDALDPDVASEGGTSLGPVLRQGAELLRASPDLADRVLVLFTDGEAHDSLAGVLAAAGRLPALGVHLIVVAEGGRTPVRIPVRDERGALLGYQKDHAGDVVMTRSREDVLAQVADAARGTLVAAELPDQAGAVRDLVASYERSRSSETRTERRRPRAWIPLTGAVLVLLAQALFRRTAALVALAALVLGSAAGAQAPRRPRSAAERAWDAGDARGAALAYLLEVAVLGEDDTSWFNVGTAALAAGDAETARASLGRAAATLDPELRFRALYNLGLLHLQLALADGTNAPAYLAEAQRAYREALLLKPGDYDAKWNLELSVRMVPPAGGGPSGSSGAGGGGGKPPPGAGGESEQRRSRGGFSQAQAEEILRSISEEELHTRRDRVGRTRRATASTVRDW